MFFISGRREGAMPYEQAFHAILIKTGPGEKDRLYCEYLQADGMSATPRVALWPAAHMEPRETLNLLNVNGLNARVIRVTLTETPPAA
jgi:hypothetical protein